MVKITMKIVKQHASMITTPGLIKTKIGKNIPKQQIEVNYPKPLMTGGREAG